MRQSGVYRIQPQTSSVSATMLAIDQGNAQTFWGAVAACVSGYANCCVFTGYFFFTMAEQLLQKQN